MSFRQGGQFIDDDLGLGSVYGLLDRRRIKGAHLSDAHAQGNKVLHACFGRCSRFDLPRLQRSASLGYLFLGLASSA